MAPPDTRTCDACGTPPRGNQKLFGCSRCNNAWYHDRDCQKEHFKTHKVVCKKIALEEAALSAKIESFGVEVVDTNSVLGRVVVTKKDFTAGHVVLHESPALIFDTQNGFSSLWTAFAQLESPYKRMKILEMQAGSLEDDKETIDEIRKDWRSYDSMHHSTIQTGIVDRSPIDFLVAKKLVEIVRINAHAYAPRQSSDGTPSKEPVSALFITASKVEHCCAPNISFETSPAGMLEYVAQLPISRGERLSISYQSHIYEEARRQRRQGLMESKGFVCECSRCLSYDECSPFDCSHCQRKGTLFQIGLDNSWECQACDWKGDESESIKNQINEQEALSQKLDHIKTRLETSGFNPSMVMECCIIQNVIASKLSRLHWLHPKAYHSLRVVATSQARFLMRNKRLTAKDPSVIAMMQIAAKSQLEHFRWLSRNIALVHGETELRTVCQNVDPADPLQERTLRSKDDIAPFLESQILNAESFFNINSQTASLIFDAGLDLLIVGHEALVAKMFAVYKEMFDRRNECSPEDRKRIQILVKSKGKRNPFSNHIVD